MATIKYPGKHDVMLGRGGESNYHSGNIAFRHMVQKYKERFRLGSRTEKNKVIDEVVNEWRDQDPVGRFVAKKTAESGDVVWYDVGNEQAKKRAAKSLAEWTPQNSFQSSTSKKSTGQERKKRSRESRNDSPSDFFSQLSASSNKRSNRVMFSPPITSDAFTVISMSSAQQQQQQQQQQQPQLPAQEVQSLAMLPQAAPQEDFISGALMAATRDHGYNPSPSNTASNSMAAPSGINQQCNININSMDVLPIERIRLQLPTAAELAGSAFSDDEKSYHSNSSRGSQHGNGLLPNKTLVATMDDCNFKEMPPTFVQASNLAHINQGTSMAVFGGQSLWMI